MTGGVYVAEFLLGRARRITVGRLGRFALPAGRYAYVGTAQRGLAARLARHGRPRKPLRWHIDYLSRWATLRRALAWPLSADHECPLASAVARLPGARPGPAGFGASDCLCTTHLFTLARPVDGAALARIDRRWSRPVVFLPERLRGG